MSKKISIKIDNKETFEIIVDGDITEIIIETVKNKYKCTTNKTNTNPSNRTRGRRKDLGVKGESRFRK